MLKKIKKMACILIYNLIYYIIMSHFREDFGDTAQVAGAPARKKATTAQV